MSTKLTDHCIALFIFEKGIHAIRNFRFVCVQLCLEWHVSVITAVVSCHAGFLLFGALTHSGLLRAGDDMTRSSKQTYTESCLLHIVSG